MATLQRNRAATAASASAGDTFDYRIVDQLVFSPPDWKRGSSYRSVDKVLAIPNRLLPKPGALASGSR